MNNVIECWSTNDEDFNYTSIEELFESNDELQVGDTVYVGEGHKPKFTDLIDADQVCDIIDNAAYDFGGEYAEGVLDNVDEAAKQELNELLSSWMDKHIKLNFYQVFNNKPVIITEELFQEYGSTND